MVYIRSDCPRISVKIWSLITNVFLTLAQSRQHFWKHEERGFPTGEEEFKPKQIVLLLIDCCWIITYTKAIFGYQRPIFELRGGDKDPRQSSYYQISIIF